MTNTVDTPASQPAKNCVSRATLLKATLGVVFFLSLSANMALAGMVAGSEHASQIITKIGSAIAAFADLSPQSRDKAIDIFKADWPKIKADLDKIHEKRAEAKEILARPDYKRADLEKVFAELRTDVTTLQAEGQGVALDIADAITPEERVKLVKSVDLKP
jgi:Spy/CpxP family protein refolding chaperone